jgi:hypothetical protein
VADLDVHDSSKTKDYDRSAESSTKKLKAPPPQSDDLGGVEFVRVPVTWDSSDPAQPAASASRRAELVGPIEKLQGLWQLAKRWQEQYWEQPIANRKVEKDFPYPLACFTRGRVDGHLNFEHDTMLGSSASYGQGIKPAVLIVIDPRCEKRHIFLSFPYVCPEPVLAK